MESNKILSASFLDLLFDDRNKEYGAYELRKTYARRITKSLLITGAVTVMVFTGVVLANSVKPGEDARLLSKVVTIQDLQPEEKLPEPIPEPVRKPEPQTRTEQLTPPVISKDDVVDEPAPTQDDLKGAKIADFKAQGVDDIGLVTVDKIDDKKGIIEAKPEPQGPFNVVEIDAKFVGNWNKFLLKNLNADVPGDNGAPPGRYTVVIQFVVDLEGNVSDIKPLTNYGYGMEQEAIRVLKKAEKWEPAIQNGHHVMAYRRQPITFVLDEQ